VEGHWTILEDRCSGDLSLMAADVALRDSWGGGEMASADGMRFVIPVSTIHAGASEIVFALAWTLGYRCAPRLADLADHRLWRIDTAAD
jgi:TnpA family transposase